MTEHHVGDIHFSLGDINEIAGRHIPQRVVDDDFGITYVENASALVRMERGLNQGLVVVECVIIIPSDACGYGIVVLLSKNRQVVKPDGNRVGRSDVGPINTSYRKRTVKGFKTIEVL